MDIEWKKYSFPIRIEGNDRKSILLTTNINKVVEFNKTKLKGELIFKTTHKDITK